MTVIPVVTVIASVVIAAIIVSLQLLLCHCYCKCCYLGHCCCILLYYCHYCCHLNYYCHLNYCCHLHYCYHCCYIHLTLCPPLSHPQHPTFIFLISTYTNSILTHFCLSLSAHTHSLALNPHLRVLSGCCQGVVRVLSGIYVFMGLTSS